ncbi:MAG: hypothetical protein KAK00_03045 [Nanoarchaeota archaeon]|nr:hypothetical protein [Nanoarchaeota archaeon]
MSKKSKEKDNPISVSREDYLLSLVDTESSSINESLSIIDEIKSKYNVGMNQIIDLVKNKDKYISVPVGLFRSELGPLEAVVRYLKDVLDYNFAQIARLLSRDGTTIWTTYNNSVKKGKLVVDLELKDIEFRGLKVKRDELIVPLSVFSERGLSILESLGLYLKETFGLNYHVIGRLLNRNERTVWTVVNRAKRKLENE